MHSNLTVIPVGMQFKFFIYLAGAVFIIQLKKKLKAGKDHYILYTKYQILT